MIVSRIRTADGHVVGVGLSVGDVARLRRERPIGFALSAAGLSGDASGDRVLLAYARPDQLVAMQNGYFPLMSDARVVLVFSDAMLDRLGTGAPLVLRSAGAPVERFVVFVGERADDASRAFRAAGLLFAPRQDPLSIPSLGAYGPPVTVVPAR